ncbi:hypothetical protein BN2475_310096 [Paraburkholderia ribeironis]|uniref:Uncharacterized protein n=1 Tax=Paraburkholderia ribeironis TaxID=1247936 RepID=A0A1N7S2L1_9BURK|nr:hypothetical protein BN2475_310096 [Paraburkholderia ribeironis]
MPRVAQQTDDSAASGRVTSHPFTADESAASSALDDDRLQWSAWCRDWLVRTNGILDISTPLDASVPCPTDGPRISFPDGVFP